MRKAIIGLAVGLLALATVGVATAQDGRVDTPCAGYAVDVAQDPNGYDMLLTVPMPPDGFQGVYLEVDGQPLIDTSRATPITCFGCRSAINMTSDGLEQLARSAMDGSSWHQAKLRITGWVPSGTAVYRHGYSAVRLKHRH